MRIRHPIAPLLVASADQFCPAIGLKKQKPQRRVGLFPRQQERENQSLVICTASASKTTGAEQSCLAFPVATFLLGDGLSSESRISGFDPSKTVQFELAAKSITVAKHEQVLTCLPKPMLPLSEHRLSSQWHTGYQVCKPCQQARNPWSNA